MKKEESFDESGEKYVDYEWRTNDPELDYSEESPDEWVEVPDDIYEIHQDQINLLNLPSVNLRYRKDWGNFNCENIPDYNYCKRFDDNCDYD